MGSLELPPSTRSHQSNIENSRPGNDDDDVSPIEEVRLTISATDDPSLPIWTFRMCFLGLLSCGILSFLNQLYSYRSEPIIVTQITVQVVTLPIGHFMAYILPRNQFRIPGFGSRTFSLNPSPFNMKEHVLLTVFAIAGSDSGSGSAYGVSVVNIIKVFYKRKISFLTAWILIITSQILGYSWAGFMRKYVVEPAHMWWPNILSQASLFQALHEKEERRISRAKFFLIALTCSSLWYAIPGYLFSTLENISWVCWVFSRSVIAQQLGSGRKGLGLGAITLDWPTLPSFSPLVTPFFTIANVCVGYVLITYIFIPIAYWGLDLYGTRRFPIFSEDFFSAQGRKYNISAIVKDNFELDLAQYEKQGQICMSIYLILTFGLTIANIAATLTHVGFFYGREIYERFRTSCDIKEDIHTRLMKKYKDIPTWWFCISFGLTAGITFLLSFMEDQIQTPWWVLLLARVMAFTFTLPISILAATANMTPRLNIVTEYIMGLILPGKPIANACFKSYGHISMTQAVSFLSHFKLGHYMKIPPRSMFLVQFIGTIFAGTVNTLVAWWLLDSIHHICEDDLLPADSPWICPGDRTFFDASVVWGLVGPKRVFRDLGIYKAMKWFFVGGAVGPIIVWLFHKAFPTQSWIPLVNLPVLLGVTSYMPSETVQCNAWIVVGTIFNFFAFHYRKQWWQRYNYILSAAVYAGVAIMNVVLYIVLRVENKNLTWWGTDGEHCNLAICPTAKGIVVDGCPIY